VALDGRPGGSEWPSNVYGRLWVTLYALDGFQGRSGDLRTAPDGFQYDCLVANKEHNEANLYIDGNVYNFANN